MVLIGPSVSVSLLGFLIVTVKLSQYWFAAANSSVIPVWIHNVWLTPTGLGKAPMKGKLVEVVAAVADGKSTIKALTDNIRIKVTAEIFVLFICIFFSFSFSANFCVTSTVPSSTL
jgi:hypothetical protein